MNIVVMGWNHKTAPLRLRERLAFDEESLSVALERLLQYDHIQEGVILSTCNRVEIYCLVDDLERGKQALRNFLKDHHRVRFTSLEKHYYFHNEPESISHLFKVASSLDSMVVGEAQILGQVKAAYARAHQVGATSKIFNTLFQRAFRVAKKIRTNTDIAKNPVSVSSVAVDLAKKIFGGLSGKVVMVLGAGKIGEMTAECLCSAGVASVLVSGRTFSRAEKLAEKFQGSAVRFEHFLQEMTSVDIVISSTAAPYYVIKEKDIIPIMKARKGRPIFLIDIAVPRDIEPKAGKIDNIYLYDIDDLKMVAEQNLKRRQAEVERGSAILSEETSRFVNWLKALQVVPTIKELREWSQDLCQAELERTLPKLANLSSENRQEIAYLAQRIAKGLLHKPIACLKKEAGKGNGYLYTSILHDLFDLKAEKEETKKKTTEATESTKS